MEMEVWNKRKTHHSPYMNAFLFCKKKNYFFFARTSHTAQTMEDE